MTPRRITAALCLVAIVLLVMAAFSKRWLVADPRSYEMNGKVRVGLTGISACIATEEIARCEKVEWSQIDRRAVGSSWMWLGRITFGLSLAAAVALLALGVAAGANVDLALPIPIPRVALWLCLAIFPFMIGYWLLIPTGLGNLVEAGRAFAYASVGAIVGAIGAGREVAAGRDFS